VVFTVGDRASAHARHWHECITGDLPPQERFPFDKLDGDRVTANLREFHRHLARTVRHVEEQPLAEPSSVTKVREAIKQAIEDRYLEGPHPRRAVRPCRFGLRTLSPPAVLTYTEGRTFQTHRSMVDSEEARSMKRRSGIVGLVAVSVVGAVTLAVIVLQSGEDRPGRDAVLEIVVEDYAMTPAEFMVPAEEEVTLVFVSDSQFDQNLTFGRSVIEEDGRPVGFQEDLLAGLDATVEPRTAWIDPTPTFDMVTLSVDPGGRVTVEVTFPEDRAGVWQVGCFLGNSCDYRVGPAGEITVE